MAPDAAILPAAIPARVRFDHAEALHAARPDTGVSGARLSRPYPIDRSAKRNQPIRAWPGALAQAYVDLMNNLGLPLPDGIQEALQPNQSEIEASAIGFPDLAQLNQVRQLDPVEVRERDSPAPIHRYCSTCAKRRSFAVNWVISRARSHSVARTPGTGQRDRTHSRIVRSLPCAVPASAAPPRPPCLLAWASITSAI